MQESHLGHIEQMNQKLAQLEKAKGRLTGELSDMSVQLDQGERQ